MKIEGIPDGWDAVRFDYVNDGESYLGEYGVILVHLSPSPTHVKRLIIRRIEKPKQYRPFANAAEFEPFRDRWVKRLDSLGSASRISGYGDKGVVIHGDIFTFNGLFRDHTFDDGTPFGIEVTE